MKLQNQTTRKIGNKNYKKWVITIPPKAVTKLGWGRGTELQIAVKDGVATIKPISKKN